MKFGLDESTITALQSVLRRYPQIQKAILYGSRAKGTYKTGSDIDLTLVGNAQLNDTLLAQIECEIDDLLLPYTIDLSILDSISDCEVRAHIDRVGVIFYQRDTAE